MAQFNSWLEKLGRKPVSIIVYTLRVLQMVYLSMRAALFDNSQGLRTIFGVISAQIYFTGFQAIPLVSVLALATGGICILQSTAQLQLIGGASMLGNILVLIIVREVGPLMTALIVIARSGTAVASELGNMRVNREIEALEVMGIDPLSYVVFPRIIGGVISVLCLAFYFDAIALMGGFFVTRLMTGMPFSFYADSLAQAFSAPDVGIFLLKNSFSGLIIFVVSCYQGMLVGQSSHEVPQATTKAVVNSVIYVTSFNLCVTTVYYISQLQKMGIITW
jgi:phospholipid/cholesterol/gamma-HCH transport system permease protein